MADYFPIFLRSTWRQRAGGVSERRRSYGVIRVRSDGEYYTVTISSGCVTGEYYHGKSARMAERAVSDIEKDYR
jgi:hypothetical protein